METTTAKAAGATMAEIVANKLQKRLGWKDQQHSQHLVRERMQQLDR
jgi:hypothetical protein